MRHAMTVHFQMKGEKSPLMELPSFRESEGTPNIVFVESGTLKGHPSVLFVVKAPGFSHIVTQVTLDVLIRAMGAAKRRFPKAFEGTPLNVNTTVLGETVGGTDDGSERY